MHDEIADAGANSDSARNPKLNLCGMFGLALVILGTVSGLLAVWFIGMVENAPQGWRYDASENWRFNLMNWIGPLALALTMFSLVGTVLAAIGVFSRPRRYSAIAAAVLLLNVCLAALFLLAWVQSMSMPRPPRRHETPRYHCRRWAVLLGVASIFLGASHAAKATLVSR